MSIDDLIRQAANANRNNDQTALRSFLAAADQAHQDPRKARRIRALAELVDIDIAAYDQGLTALDHGDTHAAETLLLHAAKAGINDPADILAELLAQDIDADPLWNSHGEPRRSAPTARSSKQRASDKPTRLRAGPHRAAGRPPQRPKAA